MRSSFMLSKLVRIAALPSMTSRPKLSSAAKSSTSVMAASKSPKIGFRPGAVQFVEQCVHLLRDLVFVQESNPAQKVWTSTAYESADGSYVRMIDNVVNGALVLTPNGTKMT
jgi:hypothetical protein